MIVRVHDGVIALLASVDTVQKSIAMVISITVRVFTSFSAMAIPHSEFFSAAVTLWKTDPTPVACGDACCGLRWEADDRCQVTDWMQSSLNVL
jgi:hypothetical protein